MKSLRALILTLAVGVFSAFSLQAYAQQEIDPDHFEPSHYATANAHAQQHAAVHHQKHVKLASGHAKHHKSHASA